MTVTVAAVTYLPSTSLVADITAEATAVRKTANYQSLTYTFMFLPIAFEIRDPNDTIMRSFFSKLSWRMAQKSRDKRKGSFHFQ